MFMFELGVCLLFGFLTGALAVRKGRSGLGWGAFGFFAPLIALVVLAFMGYQCPLCKHPLTYQQARHGECPHCSLLIRSQAN